MMGLRKRVTVSLKECYNLATLLCKVSSVSKSELWLFERIHQWSNTKLEFCFSWVTPPMGVERLHMLSGFLD